LAGLEGKKIALEKFWNLLLILLVGEVSTAFHYGKEKLPWLVAGLTAIALLVMVIVFLTLEVDREKE